MNVEKYREYVEFRRGKTPEEWLEPRVVREGPALVALPSPPFDNAAGRIQNIAERTPPCEAIGGVSVITSVAGAVRSNHWHRTDSHVLYVASGELLYWEAHPVASTLTDKELELGMSWRIAGKPYLVGPGQAFFTGPRTAHAIGFLTHTVMVSVSPSPRDKASHEADLVRVPGFVTRDMLEDVAPWIDWVLP